MPDGRADGAVDAILSQKKWQVACRWSACLGRHNLHQSQWLAVVRRGLTEYGPPKTLCGQWKRWGKKGIFARMIEGLAAAGTEQKTVMIDVRGHDADGNRQALQDKGIRPCIPGRKSRGKAARCTKRRHRTEIMFGRLQDLRRSAPAMTDAPKPSSLPSPLWQPSCSGFDDQ